MDSVYQAGALAGAPDTDTWRLYDRMNTFLDNMLLAMLESFDRARTTVAAERAESQTLSRSTAQAPALSACLWQTPIPTR